MADPAESVIPAEADIDRAPGLLAGAMSPRARQAPDRQHAGGAADDGRHLVEMQDSRLSAMGLA
jgi:hypothetical protein